jgi:hypothetical protein
MGILDDAIREHLDLKRRHGAPEEELQRQEHEALGPARREVVHQPEDGDGDAAGAEAEGTLVQEDPSPAADADGAPELGHTSDEPPADASPEERLEPEPAEQLAPKADHPPADPFADEEPFAGPAYTDEHEDGDEDMGGEGHEPVGEEGEDAEPDVLEDTPDFLQETPEHDRLWFEQKPPRDFDFD